MQTVVNEDVRCPHCRMPQIDGITHHKSRCPMNRQGIAVRHRKEDRRALLVGEPIKRWYFYHKDEVLLIFGILFFIALILFVMLMPE